MRRVILVVSAIAYLCLHITTKLFAVGILAALPFLIFFAVKRPALVLPRRMHRCGTLFCALTAAGICLWPIDGFAGWLRAISIFQRAQSFLGVEIGLLSQIAAIAFAVAGLFFVYQMVCLFYERFFAMAKEITRDFSRAEGYAALAAVMILMVAVVVIYSQTDAFAHPLAMWDLIYRSDSGAIVHQNVYLSLSALENDIRSPLFALFAAPLMGLPYLIGRLLPFPNAVPAALVAAQVPLLVASYCLLMKMIKGVSQAVRVLLPLLLLTTFGALLFTVMAEQYIVAVFYLSLCLYNLLERGKREQWLVLGAAGTMLTSAVAAFIPEKSGKKAGTVVKDGLLSGVFGVAVLITFGCFSLVLRSPENMELIFRLSGTAVALAEKLQQFLRFIVQIFLAPQAGSITAENAYVQWRIVQTGDGSMAGFVILALACIGFILNRKQAFAKVSMLWVTVSAAALGIIGWGAAENGMTLYTLYFGWAYAALLIYLIESVCKVLRIRRYSWIVYLLGGAAMLFYNLPRLWEMVRFAITNYPV